MHYPKERIKYILILSIVLTLSSNASATFITSHDLLINCKAALVITNKANEDDNTEEAEAIKAVSCIEFIDGVEEGYGIAEIEYSLNETFCIPRKFRMSERALTIVNYLTHLLENDVDLKDKPASGSVIDAYKYYYPCRK